MVDYYSDRSKNFSLEFDMKIMKVLTCIRNIIDMGFLSTYYIKEDILDELHTMMNEGAYEFRSFSLLPLKKRIGSAVEKCVVHSIIETVNLGVLAELSIKFLIMYQKITINNYKKYYDGNILLEISEKIERCVLSFKSTNLFRTEKIEGCLADFVVFILKKIASLERECYMRSDSDLILLLSQLVLKYNRLPAIQSVVLQEIAGFLTNFNTFHNMKKKRRAKDHNFEILSVLLTILFQVLDTKNSGALVRTVEFEQTRKGCAEDLCHALRSLQDFLPEYYGCHIERSIDSLSTVITY